MTDTGTPNQSSPGPQRPGSGNQDNKMLMGILAYVLFLIPLLTGDAKKDEFVKFHTKQGFALFITSVFIMIVGRIVPFLYWTGLGMLLNLGILVLFILGIVNVANGKKDQLPLIGKLGDWLKI